ncbi:MAG: class I SAM-dependent methyltransferase [Solirubrobacterales bacterium]|nr:class I SAM-dependent methyltransferase [Solirubrobacterales bacterium]
MSDRRYLFGEDVARERERLAAVERAFDARSQNALTEVGVSTGWRCWEVGAGRGSIARWLSGIVGSGGEVLATDLSDRWFDPATTGIRWLRHDVANDPLPGDRFDLVHARFLLEHLADPGSVIARIADALRPGGVLVLEDSAGLGVNITPATGVLDRFLPAWDRAGRAVGWNPTYGRELMSDLRMAGLREPQGHQYRQLAAGGSSWTHVIGGIRRLEAQLIEQGVTHEQLTLVLRCLEDSTNLIVGPPITIAWAWRA